MTDTPSTFADLGLPATLTRELAGEGKFTAFPIQTATLPDALTGRDVLGRGKTGSGKTLAFALPLVARLGESSATKRRKPRKPLGLVLAPTRELATQIESVVSPLAAAYGMRTITIFGGVSQKPQAQALNRGIDIVVACPGRLEDLLNQGVLSLDDVEITVLDEADHMADLGFLPGVTRILAKTPAKGQRLFFSATLDNGVDILVKRFLTNPCTHSVDKATSHVSAMTHHVFEVEPDDKKQLVATLASGKGKRIMFTRTKYQAKNLAKRLTKDGVPAVDLHSNLSQTARDRNLAAFHKDVNVLVATDIAARGVHVDGIELVVHVDPPAEHKAYLHRSGRTARAGSSGDVVTVMLPGQREDTKKLLRKAAIKTAPVPVSSSSEEVDVLVGERAPYVKPAPAPTQSRGGGQGGKRRGNNNAGNRGSRRGHNAKSGSRRGSNRQSGRR